MNDDYLNESSGANNPKTIEELRKWYVSKNLPPEDVTRFFIGVNRKEPKMFGICRLDNGDILVYKNKDTGERAIRYQGPDEEFAVKEFKARLEQEIYNQKRLNAERREKPRHKRNRMEKLIDDHPIIRTLLLVLPIFLGFALAALILYNTRIFNRSIFLTLLFGFLAAGAFYNIAMIIYSYTMPAVFRMKDAAIVFAVLFSSFAIIDFCTCYSSRYSGYYHYDYNNDGDEDILYYIEDDWYYWDYYINDWNYAGSYEYEDYYEDYYFGHSYSDIPGSYAEYTYDFTDSSIYEYNYSYDDDSGYDSSSSWDSYDSWDSGGTDWGSDW